MMALFICRNVLPVEGILRLSVNVDTSSVAVECNDGSILKYTSGNPLSLTISYNNLVEPLYNTTST